MLTNVWIFRLFNESICHGFKEYFSNTKLYKLDNIYKDYIDSNFYITNLINKSAAIHVQQWKTLEGIWTKQQELFFDQKTGPGSVLFLFETLGCLYNFICITWLLMSMFVSRKCSSKATWSELLSQWSCIQLSHP